MNVFQSVGASTLGKISAVGRAGVMLFGALIAVPRLKNIPLTVKQVNVVGVQSLLIILVSGLFIGMVMALQGYT
ncbi:MAG TPA: ABC transporter permease, partial [Alteromonas australica]|nr:ABC transporter permease [Alteromonas australica]HBU49902.1 ABC transporter permease [Alteromonas australica]